MSIKKLKTEANSGNPCNITIKKSIYDEIEDESSEDECLDYTEETYKPAVISEMLELEEKSTEATEFSMVGQKRQAARPCDELFAKASAP